MFNFFSELKSKCDCIKQKLSPYQIVMIGGSIFYVEGQITIMTMESNNMVFKVDKTVIIVSGKNLKIKDLSNSSLTIIGEILSWEKI